APHAPRFRLRDQLGTGTASLLGAGFEVGGLADRVLPDVASTADLFDELPVHVTFGADTFEFGFRLRRAATAAAFRFAHPLEISFAHRHVPSWGPRHLGPRPRRLIEGLRPGPRISVR